MSSSRAFRHAATALSRTGSRPAFAPQQQLSRPARAFSLTASPSSSPSSALNARAARPFSPSFATRRHAYSTAPSLSDQGLSPLGRAIITTTRTVKNLLIFTTTSVGLTYFVWSGAHAYLEQYKCPSPPGISKQVQNCLHGAWVREELSPDPDVAEVYYKKAVDLARQELEAFYKKKHRHEPRDGQQAASEDLWFLEMEKDKALTEILNRMARFYGRIGEDQQAATIWTRLWKLAERDVPHATGAASAGTFGSLFGGTSADRALITKQDGVPFAKNAADCWMRLGEYGLAEEALGWTLDTITASNTDASLDAAPTSAPSIEEVGLLSTLGALYVRQAKFDYALSVFVKALQLVQGHQSKETNVSATTVDNEKDMWFCREAILTHSIGETLYGAANASPSMVSSSSSSASTGSNSETKGEVTEQNKSSSSWKFWSSSSSSSPKSVSASNTASPKSMEQQKKEEEALGWMQKAVAMAKEKSGQNRDCDECAALGLSNLGLISEMDGKTDVALAQFKEAVIYATQANDYVGLEDYKKSVARLTEKIASASESTEPLSSSPLSPLSSS